MDYNAADILSLLITLIWTFMYVPSWINPIFHQVLHSKKVVRRLVIAANISVVAGLYKILQSHSPPSLDWFKSLPCASIVAWGVYVLVLEKPGCLPLIYIGSSTAAKYGLRNRMNEYDRLYCLPKYVDLAVKSGYIIGSKGLLLYCPIPPVHMIPHIRVVIISLEACFTFIFWAARSLTKAYGYEHHIPWSHDLVSWMGLCSHNPLKDPVVGDFDLTDEQLQAMADATKEKNRQYQKEYGKQQRANADDEYRARQKSANEKRAPIQKAIYKSNKDSKKF